MDRGHGLFSRWRVAAIASWVVLLALLIGAGTASAELVSIDGINIHTVVKAAEKQSVIVGYGANPDVPGPDVIALRKLVHKLDPGRIWIIVTPPISEHDIGLVADAVGSQLNRDGVVVGVAGYNFFVSTTWGTHEGDILANAVNGHPSASLPQLLTYTIEAFAKADAKAHHPTPLADELNPSQPSPPKAKNGLVVTTSNTSTTTSTESTTTTSFTDTSPAAAPVTTHHSHSSGSGLIEGVIFGGLVILLIAGFSVRNARRSAKAVHVRRIETKEAHERVQNDFTKLGERISDLDIDQQMKGADPQGKAEYAQALDCYQEAERRLKDEKDDYQFQKGAQAVAKGLAHLDTAEKLFDNHGRAKDLLPAEVITKLTKLAALHKSGALTDAEFAAEKKKILS